MELKQGAIGNTVEENIGNLKGNMLGTKEKLKKPFPSPHTPTQNFLECMLQRTHWLHVLLVSKTVGHHFWPALMAGAELNKEEKQKINSHPKPHPVERKNQGHS
jgi:hypothetical protein